MAKKEKGLVDVGKKYNLGGPQLSQDAIDKIVEEFKKKKK